MRHVAHGGLRAAQYGLAPECVFPSGVDDVLRAYTQLFSTYPNLTPENVAVVGDSSGGNFIVSMLLHLARENPELKPGKCVLTSPHLSFADKHDAATRAKYDPLLPFEDNALAKLASFYLLGRNMYHPESNVTPEERAFVDNERNHNPRVSPVRYLPPSLSNHSSNTPVGGL